MYKTSNMERFSMIVEFVGLPASGKSTLANNLKAELAKRDYRVAVWGDITKEYKEASIIKKLKCVPYKKLWTYLRLFSSLPLSPKRKWYHYFFFIKIEMLYLFATKYSSYDLVLNEHGIVQQSVSFLCGDHCVSESSYCCVLKDLFGKESKINICVECSINLETAMKRMIKRNRVTEGRLDAVTDLEILRGMFLAESKNFDIVLKLFKENCTSKKYLIIDANTDENTMVENGMKGIMV